MRLRNIPRADGVIDAHRAVIKKPEEQRGQWAQVFGNEKPIQIEIGMGKGQFILNMAKAHPEINFIGIERYSSVLLRALEKYDTEETVLCKLYEAKVREGIAQLAKEDACLIYLLFFEEVTIKDAAQIMGCSRKTIYNRRKRILSELRSILHDLGIVGGAF